MFKNLDVGIQHLYLSLSGQGARDAIKSNGVCSKFDSMHVYKFDRKCMCVIVSYFDSKYMSVSKFDSKYECFPYSSPLYRQPCCNQHRAGSFAGWKSQSSRRTKCLRIFLKNGEEGEHKDGDKETKN